MSSPLIQESVKDSLYLTINRPDKANALDATVVEMLLSSIKQYNHSNHTTLIIKGSGNHFCAGLDFNWLHECYKQPYKFIHPVSELFFQLSRCKKPVICITKGATYGAGIAFAVCADVAFAYDDTQFCFSEINMGIIPAMVSPYVIAAIGTHHASRYFLTGEKINANTAKRIGLIHDIYDETNLNNLIQSISQKSLASLTHEKKLMSIYKKTSKSVIKKANKLLCKAIQTPTAQEKINQFLQRDKIA